MDDQGDNDHDDDDGGDKAKSYQVPFLTGNITENVIKGIIRELYCIVPLEPTIF